MTSQQILTLVIVGLVAALVGGVIAFFLGVAYRKRVAEAEIGSAEQESKRIINDAIKNAESKKKEAVLEAKEEVLKIRTDADRDLKERRNEIQRQERRILQKEEQLDKKTENLESKEETLNKKIREADKIKEDLEGVKGEQWALLEKISAAATRRSILEQLASGEIDFVIGTHALLGEQVHFSRLGLIVTDEQHRFGVAQRAQLAAKGENPHVLVMSATPIPRTLALIIYGDLDVSVIDELPPALCALRLSRRAARPHGGEPFADGGAGAARVCLRAALCPKRGAHPARRRAASARAPRL